MKENSSIYEITGKAAASAEKTLLALEWFAGHAGEFINLNGLSQTTRIPGATLLRILKALRRRGYIERNAQKRYFSLFSLEKPDGEQDPDRILVDTAMKWLLKHCGQTVELITVRKNSLFWVRKMETPGLPLKIIAREGFSRTLYELDAPSRLYLNALGVRQIEQSFNTARFYTQGLKRAPLTWAAAKKIIRAADAGQIVYDVAGNARSVRRYAAGLSGPSGGLRYILTIAEPALESTRSRAHLQAMAALLLRAQNKIQRRSP